MVGGRCNILATAASRGSHKIGSGDERDAGRADKGEVGAGAALVGGGGSWCCSITISILGIAGNSRALWVSWSGTAEVVIVSTAAAAAAAEGRDCGDRWDRIVAIELSLPLCLELRCCASIFLLLLVLQQR